MMDDEHSTDRRVKFDFEVDFSNGGGLQGQDFRLDIEGEDMRLLMVQEVRILNKEIIADGHKRVEPSS
jgi:arylformamidase